MESRAGFEPRVSEELSFQEEEKPKENYMGLFDKTEDFKVADEAGVSVSMLDQVNEAASKAERPVEYLSKARHIQKRLDYLRENFTESYGDLLPIHKQLEQADSRTIDDIEQQLEFVESKIREGQTMPEYVGGEMVTTPEWDKYQDEVIKDPTRIAIQELQTDNDRLREVSALPKSGEDVEAEVAEQYSDEDLEQFAEFDKKPRALMGASDELKAKYESYKAEIASGKTPEDIIAARKSLVKGVGGGLREYAEGYSKLTDNLKKNQAVTALLEKVNKIERGEDIKLNSDDKLLMRALVDNAQLHEELDNDIPKAYKIGEAVGQSVGFMGEFVLTGGGATAVGKQVLKTAVKTGAKKAVGKIGVGTAVKLAQAGIQTAKMPSLYKKTAENVSNGMNFGEALLDSYWETGAEVLSERIFMQNPVSGMGANATDDIMRRMGVNFQLTKVWLACLKIR